MVWETKNEPRDRSKVLTDHAIDGLTQNGPKIGDQKPEHPGYRSRKLACNLTIRAIGPGGSTKTTRVFWSRFFFIGYAAFVTSQKVFNLPAILAPVVKLLDSSEEIVHLWMIY